MDITFVIAVALAAAVIVVVLFLVCIIIFQRWRIGDKNAALGKFITENEELRRKMHKAGIY